MTSTQTPRLLSETIPYVSPFVVDTKGDVWKRTEGGYTHRLYGYYTTSHPNQISEELKIKIYLADIERLKMGRNYNYWKSK